jgi:hypothetical protein
VSSTERAELPDEIKLCGVVLDVERVKDLRDEDGEACNGLASVDDRTIELDAALRGHDKIRFIFMHELVHHYEALAGINLKETQVDSLARSVISTMVDNPKLVEWLVEPRPVRTRKAQKQDEQQTEGNGQTDS